MTKTVTYILRVVYAIFILLFTWTLCSVCIQTTWFAPLTMSLAIAFICLFIYIYRRITKEEDSFSQAKHKKLAKRLFLINGILLVLSAVLFGVFPNTWDFGEIFRSAVSVAESKGWQPENVIYFARYTNNQHLLFAFSLLYKLLAKLFFFTSPLFRRGVYVFVSVTINLCAIQGSIFLTWKIVKKKGGLRKANMVLLFCLGFIPFYLYASIFYSDTLCMPFVIAIVYFMECAADVLQKNRKKAFVYWTLTGVAAYIGFSLKASAIFMLIALLGCTPLRFGWKKSMQIIAATTLAFCVTAGAVTFLLQKSGMFPKEYQDKYEFPYTHWIMMALLGSGGYNQKEVDFSVNQPNLAARKEANLEVIRERLKEMGPRGLLLHTDKKLLYTWGNGDLNARHYASRNPLLRTGLQKFIQSGSAAHKAFETVYNAYFQALLFFFLYSLIIACKKPSISWMLPLRIGIFALFTFLLVWETNARYLLHFSPALLLLSWEGLEQLSTRDPRGVVGGRRKKNKKGG